MQPLDEMIIYCPYCGEALDVLVDTATGEQQYYEDCAVCCQPMLLIVSEDECGEMIVDVKRNDE